MAAVIRSRVRAFALVVLALASTVAVILAVLGFLLHRLTAAVEDAPGYIVKSYSDSAARDEMARLFHIHIPANWQLVQLTSSCRVGMVLKRCWYEGSFTGPPAEFSLYPSIFQARPPETIDQPPAQPVTCDDLAAKQILPLAAGLDCTAQQHLVLSEFTVNKTMPRVGNVLIAGSATATTVRIKLGLL
ncbi:hypothetical protein [Nocardia sp. NPDC051832]|uniref:hypothetical protein n=1 Tax=Nocardia sp. NPDC051832 TaxID=3155673 RepID=UPI00342D02B1